jgi:hypothetical protein
VPRLPPADVRRQRMAGPEVRPAILCMILREPTAQEPAANSQNSEKAGGAGVPARHFCAPRAPCTERFKRRGMACHSQKVTAGCAPAGPYPAIEKTFGKGNKGKLRPWKSAAPVN